MGGIRRFEPEQMFDGDKVELKDLLGKELTIKDFRELESQYYDHNYVVVSAENNGKAITFNVNSTVLIRQLNKEKEKGLPFIAKIVKPKGKNYYTFA